MKKIEHWDRTYWRHGHENIQVNPKCSNKIVFADLAGIKDKLSSSLDQRAFGDIRQPQLNIHMHKLDCICQKSHDCNRCGKASIYKNACQLLVYGEQVEEQGIHCTADCTRDKEKTIPILNFPASWVDNRSKPPCCHFRVDCNLLQSSLSDLIVLPCKEFTKPYLSICHQSLYCEYQ